MAGLGFKDFQVAEVLTAADVDGYLMQQTVMRFASAAARGSALGTATGTAVPLAEGMVSYLDDLNDMQVYIGSSWVSVGGFNAGTAITATNASWPIPSLAGPIVLVEVIGGGGGGGGGTNGGGNVGGDGTAGGTTTFNAGTAGTATATGGAGGRGAGSTTAITANAGPSAGNGGMGGAAAALNASHGPGLSGQGGQVTAQFFDLSGISTANVTIGAGGAGGAFAGGGGNGSAGGRGEVRVYYRAG